MKQTLILFTILGLLVGGCQNDNSNSSSNFLESSSTFNLNEASKIIIEKTGLFTEAHITKDTVFLNSCFTSDARVLPPNSGIVAGIADISQLNSDWVNYGIHEFKETSLTIYGTQEYVIDEGAYYLTYGEEHYIDSGKYVNIWKNVRGTWKIYSNIWNSSLPL
ncbi:MAG: nuclear transport factor 2 family protein, partial [Cyclobacteriaceae bacterium]